MENPNRWVEVQRTGLLPYREALAWQKRLFGRVVGAKVANKHRRPAPPHPTPNFLVFTEHPPVYTLGKSADQNNLLISEGFLRKIGAEVVPIGRGGDITFHGPGQLVAYPVFDLENFFTDVHRYLRTLEEAIIATLADWGLSAGRIEGLTGVWLGHDGQGPPRKICAMGVKLSRWASMHGLALNVNTDLRFFDYIVPCGIRDKAVTSMEQELGQPIALGEVRQALQSHLAKLFEFQIVDSKV